MKTSTLVILSKTVYEEKCLMIKLSCRYSILSGKRERVLITVNELIQDPWFVQFIESASIALKKLEEKNIIYISPNGNIFPSVNFIPLED